MTTEHPQSSSDACAYRTEGLTKVYGEGEAAVHALRGVDLKLPAGEIVVLLGPSGSGKSTLLNIIGGLDRASDGKAWFGDQELSVMSDAELTRYRRDNVGFVFQFYNLMPSLTARENVELVTEIADNPMDPDEALALVGLRERVDHFPAQLSGGEQQRVAIARAIAKRPKVLFCDEPTGALDSMTGRAVLKVLKDVNETLGSTVLIVTHAAATARARSGGAAIPIVAPVSGRVLKVTQQSAATLAAGAQIMEIGDTQGDLEVLVELLSTDAVQVSPGDKVLIDNWGGSGTLATVVSRIEPQGFTKVSALGVEEQRVNTIVRLTDARIGQVRLGSGFRVEARIVVWEDKDTVIVPSSALFREQGDWAVFVVTDGRARRRTVKIGRNNGTQAQVLEGLKKGETVILFPASDIADGTRVERRSAG